MIKAKQKKEMSATKRSETHIHTLSADRDNSAIDTSFHVKLSRTLNGGKI